MKNAIFYFLFKKQLNQWCCIMDENREKVKLMNRKLAQNEKIMAQSELKYKTVKRIFDLIPTAKVVGIEKNKKGEELFVVERIDSRGLTMYLFGISYQGITGLPRIVSTFKEDYDEDYNIVSNHLYIDDVQNEDDNIGNGSILMKYFIKSAKQNQVKYINGWLSPVDIDHFDRLEHYYKKFGFDVNFNEDRTSGSIELEL